MRYLIGIGTYMGLDDSIGLRVAETIAAEGLDRGFRAVELRGNLLDLLHYVGADSEGVLVVDSARMGLEPGEYMFFSPDDVASRKELPGISTHEGDLMKVLELGRALGYPRPRLTILGIEPSEIGPEMGLSQTLEERFREYVQVAVRFMEGCEELV
ncbi:MAG: hydrogenase maturation protease [Coriobacteriia bacterium]|nr:hydrogenase maturation protease [Coriobacteriia bacterium]